jgi:hypothetical protein
MCSVPIGGFPTIPMSCRHLTTFLPNQMNYLLSTCSVPPISEFSILFNNLFPNLTKVSGHTPFVPSLRTVSFTFHLYLILFNI